MFRYCESEAQLLQMATNMFNCLKSGGKIVIMYVPGAKPAEAIEHVLVTLFTLSGACDASR